MSLRPLKVTYLFSKVVCFLRRHPLFTDFVIAFPFYAGTALIMMRKILWKTGTIGIFHDWAIPQFPGGIQNLALDNLYIWTPYNLGRATIYPTQYFLKIILGFLGTLGINGNILSKGLCLFALILSGLSMYFLVKKVVSSKVVIHLFAGFFYMSCPIMFNRIVAGHDTYLISYAFAPLVLKGFFELCETEQWSWRKIFLYGIVAGIACTHLQFIPILFFILFAYAFFTMQVRVFAQRLSLALAIGTVAFLFHLPIFFAILSHQGDTLSLISKSTTLEWLKGQSLTIFDALRFIGYVSHYFTKSVKKLSGNFFLLWTIVSFVLPLFALAAVCIKPKEKKVYFFLSLALLFFFPMLGKHHGFDIVVAFLFHHVPIIRLFREVYHLMVGPALMYSLLLAYSLSGIIEKMDRLISRTTFKWLHSLQLLTYVVAFGCVLLAFFPIFTGNFCGKMQVFSLHKGYETLCNRLAGQEEDCRALWLPLAQPMRYKKLKLEGYSPLVFGSPKPTFGNQHLNPIVRCLVMALRSETFLDLNYLLNTLAIKTIVLQADFLSSMVYFYPYMRNMWINNRLQQTLRRQQAINNIRFDSGLKNIASKTVSKTAVPFSIWENISPLPRVWSPDRLKTYVGNTKDLLFDPETNMMTQRKTAYVKLSHEGTMLPGSQEIDIWNDGYLDYVLSRCPNKYHIDLTQYTKSTGNIDKGWVDLFFFWWWRHSFHYVSCDDNQVFTRTHKPLQIPLHDIISTTQPHRCFIKAWVGPKGTPMSIYLNSHLLSVINTSNGSCGSIKWFDLGTIPKNWIKETKPEFLTIQPLQTGEHLLHKLVLVPDRIYQMTREEAEIYLSDKETRLVYSTSQLRSGTISVPLNGTYETQACYRPRMASSHKIPFLSGSIANMLTNKSLIKSDTAVPLCLFYGKGFDKREKWKTHVGVWRWVTDTIAHAGILNAQGETLSGTLSFEALSHLGPYEMYVYQLGASSKTKLLTTCTISKKVQTIHIPSIALRPGMNQLLFHIRGGNPYKVPEGRDLYIAIGNPSISSQATTSRKEGHPTRPKTDKQESQSTTSDSKCISSLSEDKTTFTTFLKQRSKNHLELLFSIPIDDCPVQDFPLIDCFIKPCDKHIRALDYAFLIEIDKHTMEYLVLEKVKRPLENANLFGFFKKYSMHLVRQQKPSSIILKRIDVILNKKWGTFTPNTSLKYAFLLGDITLHKKKDSYIVKTPTLQEPLPLRDFNSANYLTQSPFTPTISLDGTNIVDDYRICKEESAGIYVQIRGKEIDLKTGLHKINYNTPEPFELATLKLRRISHPLHLENNEKQADTITSSTNASSPQYLDYEVINPTLFRVIVRAEHPFWIVFSENFASGWQAHIRTLPKGSLDQETDKEITKQRKKVSSPATRLLNMTHSFFRSFPLLWHFRKSSEFTTIKQHHLVNSFANGWFVDEDLLNSNEGEQLQEIWIEYRPQRYYQIGMVVALGLFLTFCCLIAFSLTKKSLLFWTMRKKKNTNILVNYRKDS